MRIYDRMQVDHADDVRSEQDPLSLAHVNESVLLNAWSSIVGGSKGCKAVDCMQC